MSKTKPITEEQKMSGFARLFGRGLLLVVVLMCCKSVLAENVENPSAGAQTQPTAPPEADMRVIDAERRALEAERRAFEAEKRAHEIEKSVGTAGNTPAPLVQPAPPALSPNHHSVPTQTAHQNEGIQPVQPRIYLSASVGYDSYTEDDFEDYPFTGATYGIGASGVIDLYGDVAVGIGIRIGGFGISTSIEGTKIKLSGSSISLAPSLRFAQTIGPGTSESYIELFGNISIPLSAEFTIVGVGTEDVTGKPSFYLGAGGRYRYFSVGIDYAPKNEVAGFGIGAYIPVFTGMELTPGFSYSWNDIGAEYVLRIGASLRVW